MECLIWELIYLFLSLEASNACSVEKFENALIFLCFYVWFPWYWHYLLHHSLPAALSLNSARLMCLFSHCIVLFRFCQVTTGLDNCQNSCIANEQSVLCKRQHFHPLYNSSQWPAVIIDHTVEELFSTAKTQLSFLTNERTNERRVTICVNRHLTTSGDGERRYPTNCAGRGRSGKEKEKEKVRSSFGTSVHSTELHPSQLSINTSSAA